MAILFGISLAIAPSGHTHASAVTAGTNEGMNTVGHDLKEAKKTQAAYGKLPLSFIQNNGQIDKKVKFYEMGSNRATFFTKVDGNIK
jgi:hypothetical protein